jgi:serine protease Do
MNNLTRNVSEQSRTAERITERFTHGLVGRIANRSALATAGVLLACTPIFAASPATEGVAAARVESEAKSEARGLSRAFRSAARKLSPSVVTINTTTNPSTNSSASASPDLGRMLPPGLELPPGMQFPGMQTPPGMRPKQGPARGTGTGAVISRDGYIVTANHVVADADEIEIVFHDGRSAKAEVVGLDPGTDIAVLKMAASDAKELMKDREPASFGDSASLDIGDWVVAIGAPFGLEQTVTAGIVSATSRSDVGLATFENYIQTDAAINPGNSGGPLANLDGEIIGINSCISSKGGGNDGIGFSVPSAVVKRVVESIIADGRVARGWLGISVQPADGDMAASLGADGAIGVVVNQVVPGSPAEHAGLEAGDLITEVGGAKVRTPGELIATIGQREPGSSLEITAFRGGEKEAFSATLAEREDGTAKKAKTPEKSKPASALDRLGMSLTELSASDAAGLGISAEDGALVVERVEEEGPAAAAGIEPGDVIRRIGARNARTLDEANAAMDAMREGASVPVLVEREGRARFLLLKPASNTSDAPAMNTPAPSSKGMRRR